MQPSSQQGYPTRATEDLLNPDLPGQEFWTERGIPDSKAEAIVKAGYFLKSRRELLVMAGGDGHEAEHQVIYRFLEALAKGNLDDRGLEEVLDYVRTRKEELLATQRRLKID